MRYASQYDRIEFVALTDRPSPWSVARVGPVSFHHVFVEKKPLWYRFAVSLPRSAPAIAVRFTPRAVQRQLTDLIQRLETDARFDTVVIEDVPLGLFIDEIKRVVRGATVLLRSHNVLEEAFESFLYDGPLYERLAWRLELHRMRNFERRVLQGADTAFAISQRDAEEYVRRYKAQIDGVIGVLIDVERYAHVSRGAPNTIVVVGSADLRKGHGLRKFVDQTWPLVKSHFPSSRLVLGGRGTESFDDPELGVEGRGYVVDDRDVLSEGAIFLNPQIFGSGIKLKSLVAMASGKCLVSTPKGVEGIDGTEGQDYIVCRSRDEWTTTLIKLLNNVERLERTGSSGRALVSRAYSIHRSPAAWVNSMLDGTVVTGNIDKQLKRRIEKADS